MDQVGLKRTMQPCGEKGMARLSFQAHSEHIHSAWRAKQAKAHHLDLRALAGLRALACLGILVGHLAYWVAAAHADKHKVYAYFSAHAWTVVPLNASEPAMDMFMVLTGFLAALSLVPALEVAASPGAVMARYYMRRVLRIVPAYYSALALVYLVALPLQHLPRVSQEAKDAFFTELPFATDQCARNLWANIVFAHNALPMGGCYSITWSLAVQMQFYAVFPLLLVLLRPSTPGFRLRVAVAAAAAVAASLALRARVFLALRLWERMPLALLGPHTAATRTTMDVLSQETYLSLLPRGAALACGVLAALVAGTPRCAALAARLRGPLLAAACLVSAAVAGGLAENRFGTLPDPCSKFADPTLLGFGFVAMPGALQPLAASALVVLATCAPQQGVFAWLRAVLGSRALARLANLSYSIFLLHPLVILGVFAAFPPSAWFSAGNPLPFAGVFASMPRGFRPPALLRPLPPVLCTATRPAPTVVHASRRLRKNVFETGRAVSALAPAVLESPSWAPGNLVRWPHDQTQRELATMRGHARHLEDHVAALQHGREAMRAELQSAHAQLRAAAAERDTARAEAAAAMSHAAALQADLRATDRMDKADLWCSYARIRNENQALTDDLDACRGQLRRTESALEAEAFEKMMAGRSANQALGLAIALLHAV
ncbi:hypothetical protein WJX81_003721 [Elliptochloris bilobata]|uniref:Acyltransferase 3 domain-containing protein n=1 Tax=Elliptochloris bilobata TaxID=381761 RepID=A0AAW1S6W5_9CHLO